MSKRWYSTGYLAARPIGSISKEQGVISGVSVVTAGEAKGHHVYLDEAFIDEAIKQGNEARSGVKARFGHPNMCSTALGTFIGRFKNFRKQAVVRDDGQAAYRAVADLFMSNAAKDTPNGNLYDYVFNMAQSEADMFGTSIVFSAGREYKKRQDGSPAYIVYETDADGNRKYASDGLALLAYVDKDGQPIDARKEPLSDEVYVELEKLHACDAVDDPAANDGLFSRFAQETIAGQITEFLDLHQEVWNAVSDNPEIMQTLARYADKLDEFVARYKVYRAGKGEAMKDSQQDTGAEPSGKEPAPTQDEPKIDAAAEPATENPDKAEPAEPEQPKTEQQKQDDEKEGGAGEADGDKPKDEPPPPVPAEQQKTDREEFTRMVKDFGPDVASEVFASGGGYAEAMKLGYERMKERVALLEKQVGRPAGGTPAAFVAGASQNADEIRAKYAGTSDPIERAKMRKQYQSELGCAVK